MDTTSVLVMLFRLTNAPSTFMDKIHRILKQYLDDFLMVLVDDILIYSKSHEDHEQYFQKTL